MKFERQLILQELTLRPSSEWLPNSQGWLVLRVAEGTGFWLQTGANARQLTVGDGFIANGKISGILRAGQLGLLKLQFFIVQPQHLLGLLTVAEWHQFEIVPGNRSLPILFFTNTEPIGQKFTRLVGLSHFDRLPERFTLLQLWAAAIVSLHPTQDCAVINHGKLRDRFRQLINQITAAEFCSTSSKVFAQEIGCSERYFNSLFSEEFGILPRTHQTKLRTQYALQPLENAHPKICPSSVTPATGFSPDTADNSIRQVLDKIPGLPVSTTTRKSKGKQAVPRVGRVTVLLPTKTN